MFVFIQQFIIALGLIIGSATDFKKREVPDWLNFSLIGVGLGLGLLNSITTLTFQPFLSSLLGFITGFIIGHVMFYTGQWGGGDAKLIMGLGALFGLSFTGLELSALPLFILFLINTIFAGAIYGLIWALLLAIKNRKKIRKAFIEKIHEKSIVRYRIIILSLTVFLAVLAFLSKNLFLRIGLILLAGIIFFLFYLWLLTKIVEQTCMIKTISMKKLTEGEWVYQNVWVPTSYTTLKDHFKKEQDKWLEEKKSYDELLGLCKETGMQTLYTKRLSYLEKKATKAAAKKQSSLVIALQKKYGLAQKETLALCTGTKKNLEHIEKKHPGFLQYIKKEYSYDPKQELVCGPKDLGILKEQIATLKKHGIQEIIIKEGMPFVPSFLLAYIITLALGNWLLFIF